MRMRIMIMIVLGGGLGGIWNNSINGGVSWGD